ncbi:MAG: hypothetical protein J5I53_07435 [Bradyrhizobiaceae bacterium]|nr:hypothetical protein [Bradyrhizobiaceae bacterium]
MLWKSLIVIAVLAIIAGGAVWISHGSHTLTKDREKVVTLEKDELFGTTHEKVEWVEKFTYGFFPDDTAVTTVYRGYVFVLGSSLAVIALSVVMLRRQKKQA